MRINDLINTYQNILLFFYSRRHNLLMAQEIYLNKKIAQSQFVKNNYNRRYRVGLDVIYLRNNLCYNKYVKMLNHPIYSGIVIGKELFFVD